MIAEVNKNVVKSFGNILEQVVGPGAARQYAPPPDGISTRGGSTSVRGRVRTSPASGQLQAARSACPQPGWDRQTDRRTDHRIT